MKEEEGLGFEWEIYNIIINYIEQVHKVDHEKALVSTRCKEFREIHARYSSMYGGKYGINEKSVEEILESKDLERMMHLIRAEAGQPRRIGFFGSGGLKREEYYNVTNRLNLVESNLVRILGEWEANLAGRESKLRKKLCDYDKEYTSAMRLFAAMSSNETYQRAEDVVLEKIPIAEVSMELPENSNIANIFSESGFSFWQKGKILLTVSAFLKSMKSCCIQYESGEQLEHIYSWVRALNKQMLLCFPAYHYNLLYFDALNSARGLKEFLGLQDIHEDYVKDIEPHLYDDRLDVIKIARDGESIRNQLQQLEEYMGRVTDVLQGCRDVETYNEQNHKKIPVRIVVMEGMENYLEDSIITKLLINGRRCGICMVLLLNKQVLKAFSWDKLELKMASIMQNCMMVQYENGIANLVCGVEKYAVRLLEYSGNQKNFTESLRKQLEVRKQIDNNFAACFPEDYQWGTYVSTGMDQNGNAKGKIMLPIALNKRGEIVSIELGSADFVHGLISGVAGSGKTTLLHMIINAVVMNYSPNDVEIWLVDYKQTEMAVYIKHRPPHVKFIGIERNEEFTFSMIDLISDEYQRRMKLFTDVGVRNIDVYKQRFGVNSMPRLFIIIDEFHVMAQQIYENHEYSERLENILAEGRAMGIVCLFSDQAVSVGLKGLTEKGKKQMRQRLAMMNDKEEMSATLDMRISDADTVMQAGEVKRKITITKRRPDGEQIQEYELEQDKVIYINDQQREDVARKAILFYGEGEQPIIVDGTMQTTMDWNLAAEHENPSSDGRERINLYLGKPSNFAPCFVLPLSRDYGQNLICVHEREDIKEKIIFHLIESFLRKEHSKVYVMADAYDGLYIYIRKRLGQLNRLQSKIVVISKMPDICSQILEFCDELEKRRKCGEGQAIMVIWLGLESMLKEFEYYDELPKERRRMSSKNLMMQQMEKKIEARLSFLLDGVQADEPQAKIYGEDELYDAREMIEQMIREGSKRGIFQSIFMSNLLAVKSSKRIKLEQFTYKMSGFLDRDNAIDFYGTARFMNGMSSKEENSSCVCYDGRRARFFIPYKLKEMEDNVI